MNDIEKRAHDLAVEYVVKAQKEFKVDESKCFEFGSAYAVAYQWILKSLKEKTCF